MAKPLSKKIGAFALMTWLCVFSGPMLLLVSLVFDGNPMQYILYANFNSWLTVIFLGFFMQPVGYAAWYYVLKKYPVNKVMPVLLILPVTGLITSIFLLGEDPPKQVFLGGLVIISGVALILFTKSNKKKEKRK
jgi:O-acetylserine/cysteine efflux transporter